jgi:hypothetical protein
MPIRPGSKAAVIGYEAPELRTSFADIVHFGTADDIKSKSDIPDGLDFICMGPDVVPGHRSRIKSSASSRNVRVEEVPAELLSSRLRGLRSRHGGASPPDPSPTPAPTISPESNLNVLIVGATGGQCHQGDQLRFEPRGARYATAGSIRSLRDISSVDRLFLAGDESCDGDAQRLILRLADQKNIPVGRFTTRTELLEYCNDCLALETKKPPADSVAIFSSSAIQSAAAKQLEPKGTFLEPVEPALASNLLADQSPQDPALEPDRTDSEHHSAPWLIQNNFRTKKY